MAGDPGRPGEASSQMLQLLNSFLTVQGLHVAATLGIADLLADGARGVDDLANAAGAHPASLYRLMRMLAGAGVFREEADGRFALPPSAVPSAARGRSRSGIGRSLSARRRCGRPGVACATAL
jgi:hypothetical protein